eukprot:g24702.t1
MRHQGDRTRDLVGGATVLDALSSAELLPPLRGVGLASSLGSRGAVSGIHTPEEEVSLGEQSGGASESGGASSDLLDEVDRQLAILNRPGNRVGLTPAAVSREGDGLEASASASAGADH